jgi:predicted nucleic acid-binding protein
VSIILDTCVWSHFLRRDRAGGEAVSGEVARLIRADAVVMMGPIRQELLSGVQSSRYKQLKEYLRFFPNLPLQEEDDETAAGQYNLLRENGIQGGSTDLLICAAAIRRGLRIFTIDRDFEFYEKHLPIALHKVR